MTYFLGKNSLLIRNIIWITYLATSLIQLVWTILIFGLYFLFSDEGQCTEMTVDFGTFTYKCEDVEDKSKSIVIGVFIGLISYFTLKTCYLVFFLKLFARKAI